ncbi:MAG: hypothetical protein ACM3IJ_03270 [Candidatus Levyibacteriota bacterium]
MIKQTARFISFLFHPFFIAIIATFLIVFKNTSNLVTSLEWSLVAGLFSLIVFIFEYYGVKKGYFSNFDVSRRRQRAPLFTFVIVTMLAFILMLFVLHGPMQLIIGAACLTVSILILSVVNMWVKASVHVAGISAFLLSMGIIYGGYVYLAIFLIPLVAWSRVKIHRHTIPEVITGGCLGIFLTMLSYLVVQYLH